MTGSAPKEIQGISTGKNTENNEFVDVAAQETAWRNGIGREVGKVDPSFQPEHTIPPGSHLVRKEQTTPHIQPGVDAQEPLIDTANIVDFIGKTARHVPELINNDKGSLTHVEISAGPKVVSLMDKRAEKLANQTKQPDKKAA